MKALTDIRQFQADIYQKRCRKRNGLTAYKVGPGHMRSGRVRWWEARTDVPVRADEQTSRQTGRRAGVRHTQQSQATEKEKRPNTQSQKPRHKRSYTGTGRGGAASHSIPLATAAVCLQLDGRTGAAGGRCADGQRNTDRWWPVILPGSAQRPQVSLPDPAEVGRWVWSVPVQGSTRLCNLLPTYF